MALGFSATEAASLALAVLRGATEEAAVEAARAKWAARGAGGGSGHPVPPLPAPEVIHGMPRRDSGVMDTTVEEAGRAGGGTADDMVDEGSEVPRPSDSAVASSSAGAGSSAGSGSGSGRDPSGVAGGGGSAEGGGSSTSGAFAGAGGPSAVGPAYVYPPPPSIHVGIVMAEFAAEYDASLESGSFSKVIRLIGQHMRSCESLSFSFLKAPGTPATWEDSGVDLDQVERFYVMIQRAPGDGVKNSLFNAAEAHAADILLPHSSFLSLESLRQFLISLLNPMLLDPDYHLPILSKVCRTIERLRPPQLAALKHWMSRLSTQMMQRMVSSVQQYITLRLMCDTSISEISPPVEVLGILNSANEEAYSRTGRRVVTFLQFYNDVASNNIELRDDFRRWLADRSREMERAVFSFCGHPYILDASAKSQILRFESVRQMSMQAGSGMFRHHSDYFKFVIRREHMLEDTLRNIVSVEPKSELKKQLMVKFEGEDGIDQGGVKKEFFQIMTRRMFAPDFGMFKVEDDGRTMWFNQDSFEANIQFQLIGSLIGLAIYNSVLLDLHFPLIVYQKLVGIVPKLSDLAIWKPDVARNLQMLLDYDKPDFEDVFGLTFTLSYESFGHFQVVELKRGGEAIVVTQGNKQEYVDLYVDYLCNKSVESKFAAFSRGFLDVAGGPALDLFRPEELELLVIGNEDLDFVALEKSTLYEEPFEPAHPVIRNFWSVLHSFNQDEKKRFLSFCTGSDRAPIKGLGSLKFVISRAGPDSEQLPTSHTCYNHLLLPDYGSREKMEDKLRKAILQSEGFGLM